MIKVFLLIRNRPALELLIIGAFTVGVAKFLVFSHKYVTALMKRNTSQVDDVIMFNELGFDCILEHRAHCRLSGPYRCQNVYCTQQNIDRIIAHLTRAKYSIDLAMYSLYSTKMISVLEQAILRKISVRIIVSLQSGSSMDSKLLKLKRCGAQLRSQNSDKYMHHKFCIIDGCARSKYLTSCNKGSYKPQHTPSILINGSVNWTQGGFGANWENVVISSNPLMNSVFEEEFERMWQAFGDGKYGRESIDSSIK